MVLGNRPGDPSGLAGARHGARLSLTVGRSLLEVESGRRRATAYLHSEFATRPLLLQQRLWAFAVVTLLRDCGLYALHAAGLVSREGAGVLLIGASGCGKSTLALGLVAAGWRYLSDDAVMLSGGAARVTAWALRRPFSLAQAPSTAKRRIDVRGRAPRQFVSRWPPAMLLFPHIVSDATSTLRPIPRGDAIGRLFRHSGSPLFDRVSTAAHFELLAALARQTECLELRLGKNLHHHPESLVDLLAAARVAV
jgi:hypothetical protein